MSDSYDDYEVKIQLAEHAWEKRVDEMVKTNAMMTDKELMQKALEKLEFFAYTRRVSKDTQELINILRKRLFEMI